MIQIYKKNGLVFWNQYELETRNEIISRISKTIISNLQSQNKGFRSFQIEAPILTPPECTTYETYKCNDLILRPETTYGSYEYAKYLLKTQKGVKLPIIVWQHGKSFRREQDQVTKNMRLKEFNQLEFQIMFSDTTINDYGTKLIPTVKSCIEWYVGPCSIGESDRLPEYSTNTIDIILNKTGMELCSISYRKDFNLSSVLEVAIGLDRLVYNDTFRSNDNENYM